MPALTIFAGPNGSGKSSIIRRVDFVGRNHLLEADAIASRLQVNDPRQAAIAARREVIRRTHGYLASGEDFAIETTLSGSWTTGVIKQARVRHFSIRLVYICLDNPEQSIQRVHERVAQGGHDVPDHDVRRRYGRSLANLPEVLTMADEALIYDNSGTEPMLILEIRSGVVVITAQVLPTWAHELVERVRP